MIESFFIWNSLCKQDAIKQKWDAFDLQSEKKTDALWQKKEYTFKKSGP